MVINDRWIGDYFLFKEKLKRSRGYNWKTRDGGVIEMKQKVLGKGNPRGNWLRGELKWARIGRNKYQKWGKSLKPEKVKRIRTMKLLFVIIFFFEDSGRKINFWAPSMRIEAPSHVPEALFYTNVFYRQHSFLCLPEQKSVQSSFDQGTTLRTACKGGSQEAF